jgi:hypothetical protein
MLICRLVQFGSYKPPSATLGGEEIHLSSCTGRTSRIAAALKHSLCVTCIHVVVKICCSVYCCYLIPVVCNYARAIDVLSQHACNTCPYPESQFEYNKHGTSYSTAQSRQYLRAGPSHVGGGMQQQVGAHSAVTRPAALQSTPPKLPQLGEGWHIVPLLIIKSK